MMIEACERGKGEYKGVRSRRRNENEIVVAVVVGGELEDGRFGI